MFGAFLKKKRLELGVNRYQLSIKIGVSGTWVYQVEAGTRNPSLHSAEWALEAVNSNFAEYEAWKNDETSEFVRMPTCLTAENGAKGILSGEFFEHIERLDDDEGQYVEDVMVSWTNIKDIHKMAVKYFGVPIK